MEGKALKDWMAYRKVNGGIFREGSVVVRLGGVTVVVIPGLRETWRILASVGTVGVAIRRPTFDAATDVAEAILKRADAGDLDAAGMRLLARQLSRRDFHLL